MSRAQVLFRALRAATHRGTLPVLSEWREGQGLLASADPSWEEAGSFVEGLAAFHADLGAAKRFLMPGTPPGMLALDRNPAEIRTGAFLPFPLTYLHIPEALFLPQEEEGRGAHDLGVLLSQAHELPGGEVAQFAIRLARMRFDGTGSKPSDRWLWPCLFFWIDAPGPEAAHNVAVYPMGGYTVDVSQKSELQGFASGLFGLAFECLNMINHRAVRVADQPGRRALLPGSEPRKGERYAFSEIRLTDRVRREYAAEAAERARVRHMEHDVRSHLRRLRSGKVIQVRAHRRGDPALGSKVSQYKVGW